MDSESGYSIFRTLRRLFVDFCYSTNHGHDRDWFIVFPEINGEPSIFLLLIFLLHKL